MEVEPMDDQPADASRGGASAMEVGGSSGLGGQPAATSGLGGQPAATSSLSVHLHPLVILNVAEHWTRTKAQNGGVVKQVIGAIIGKQEGRSIEVINSFELRCLEVDGESILDREYYNLKESQFKQVFVDLELIGWYCTGPDGTPSANETQIHKQVSEINESAILFMLHPQSRHGNSLPVSIFESVIDLRPVGGEEEAVMSFLPVPYQLETEDGERVGLDHIARVGALEYSASVEGDRTRGASDSGTSETTTTAHVTPSSARHLLTQHNAVTMLLGRVKLLQAYLQAVRDGSLPKDHEVVRQCYSLCHRLPVLSTPHFKQEFFNQANDVCLMAYLGAITKGCNSANQFVTKFNLVIERQGMGKRLRGLFM